MPERKLFTVAEANACVPRLAFLVERLQEAARRLEAERAAAASDALETILRERPAARLLVEEIDALVEDIAELGGELKDVRLGLIDFPARLEPGGEVVCLCWQFGEPEIAFWHRPADGFAGRQPLPGASAHWLQ